MKFTKTSLKERYYDQDYVQHKLIGYGRWSLHYYGVFEHDGKFYSTTYSQGATESQDEHAYDYEPDEIECPEVKPVEVLTLVYQPVKESL